MSEQEWLGGEQGRRHPGIATCHQPAHQDVQADDGQDVADEIDQMSSVGEAPTVDQARQPPGKDGPDGEVGRSVMGQRLAVGQVVLKSGRTAVGAQGVDADVEIHLLVSGHAIAGCNPEQDDSGNGAECGQRHPPPALR